MDGAQVSYRYPEAHAVECVIRYRSVRVGLKLVGDNQWTDPQCRSW